MIKSDIPLICTPLLWINKFFGYKGKKNTYLGLQKMLIKQTNHKNCMLLEYFLKKIYKNKKSSNPTTKHLDDEMTHSALF